MNKKEKILLLIAVILSAGSLGYYKIVIPFGNKWKEQTINIRQRDELAKSAPRLLKKEKELTEKFLALSERIQAKLPLERKESGFLGEIDRVAKETNVHIETMNPRPIRELGSFRELSVEINMETNLGNLVRFLYEIRRSSVVLVANKLTLQPKSERSALLKGHLIISTIFLKEK